MIENRTNNLLNYKIYIYREKKSGKFLTQCQNRVLKERIKESGIDLSSYIRVSLTESALSESIYRYATDDKEIKLCKQCNNNRVEFVSINYGWREFCGSHCSSKYKSDNNHSWITSSGWKHSEETKKKMSANHADFTGENNPFKQKMNSDCHFREEMRKNKIDYWSSLTEDRKKELSEIFSKGQANSNKKSENSHKNHKSGYFYSKKMKKEMFYRSSWELKVCKYLDRKDNNIKKFDIEPFCIKYYLNSGEIRYTRIDFHITYYDGRQKIVEVKPSSFLTSGNVPYKIKGCEQYAESKGINFVLITENELKKLEEVLK